MRKRIKLDVSEAGFTDLRGLLEETVADSGLSSGILTIRAMEPGVGLLHGPKAEEAKQDLWDDYARLFDGGFGPTVKATVGGQALELIIVDGRPLLGEEETICAAGYGGKKTAEIMVCCFG